MNIIDLVVIVLILLYVLNGIYRGFVPSLMNLGGFFVSWVVAFLTYPLLSRTLINSEFFSSLRFYIEGAERVGDYTITSLPVSSITPDQLSSIMETAKMPQPYDAAIVENIRTQAFESQGITTLGDYFDMTIYSVMINIISLLIIFVILRILLTLLTNAFSYAVDTPQLRRFDALTGGGVGLLRGFFSMHLLFAVVPIALILLPVQIVTDLVNSSQASSIFYSGSIVLRFISGSV